MSKVTKTTANNAVAVVSTFKLEHAPNYLEKIVSEIKQLKGDREKVTVITEPLGPFGKISDITNKDTLRIAYAYVTKKLKGVSEFDSVFEAIDNTTKLQEVKENGYTLKQWQDSILAKYADASFEARLAKLEKAKAIIQNNLSAEQKFVADMTDVADLFTN
jgi:hypothetical protein